MSMTSAQVAALIKLIDSADMQDVKMIFDLANRRVKSIQALTAVQFRVNQKVSFKGRYGEIVEGIVTKVNQKTIKVKATTGVLWSVSPSLLKAA